MTTREKELERIIQDTFWMARRYANGRHTVAPSIVNESLAALVKLGVEISPDPTLVEDGNGSANVLDVR